MNFTKKLWIVAALLGTPIASQATTLFYETDFYQDSYALADLKLGNNIIHGSVTIDHIHGDNGNSDILHLSGWAIETPINGKITSAKLISTGNFTPVGSVYGAKDQWGNDVGSPDDFFSLSLSASIDLFAMDLPFLGKYADSNSTFDAGENLFGGSVLFNPRDFYSGDARTGFYFNVYTFTINVAQVDEPSQLVSLLSGLAFLVYRRKLTIAAKYTTDKC